MRIGKKPHPVHRKAIPDQGTTAPQKKYLQTTMPASLVVTID
ncbi:hypothetical protein [Pontibacter diazotrophicus]|nr:hypothetical protein [Pontibacter diazotrophicus]